MATTALYRLSSFEVVKISVTGQTFSDRDVAYWGVLTDPALPNGNQAVDANGTLRILGISKFAVVGSNTVRNATQPEIDTFAPAQSSDEADQDAAEAIKFFDTHPRFRKAFKSVGKLVVDELNILRSAVIGKTTLVWDAPSMANAAGATSPNITVTGAAFGDVVTVACSASFAGLVAFGSVTAANTVVIRLHNGTGAATNPGNLTYTVVVRRDVAMPARTYQQAFNALAALVDPGD